MKGRRPVVTVQFPDNGARRLRDSFHRIEADSGSAEDLHAAVDAILADPESTVRGLRKHTFPKRKPALKRDEEVIPGVAVDAAVDRAFAT